MAKYGAIYCSFTYPASDEFCDAIRQVQNVHYYPILPHTDVFDVTSHILSVSIT